MDNLLQEHGISHHRFFLGGVDISHLVQGRTPRIMRLTLSGPGGSGVISSMDGLQRYAVTTREHWRSHPATGVGSNLARSAQTYVVASERQSHCSEDRSAMSMSMDIWTDTSPGTSSHSPNNSTAFAINWQKGQSHRRLR